MNNSNIMTQNEILSTLKLLWEEIYQVPNKTVNLEGVEKSIENLLKEGFGLEEEKFLKMQMDIVLQLDEAKLEGENIAIRGFLSTKTIEMLELLRKQRVYDIEPEEGEILKCGTHVAEKEEYREGEPRGKILKVLQRGFRKGKEIIYPARVAVSSKEKEESEEKKMDLGKVEGSRVLVDFEGGDITSDTGFMILKEVDKKDGIINKIAGAIEDNRNKSYVVHELEALLRQRIYQIDHGYEDANDSNFMRYDPALKTALGRDPYQGRDLASQPTISRFENSITGKDLTRIERAIGKIFIESYEKEPDIIVLDFDTTEDLTYGNQQMTFFNAYSGSYCYWPLHVYEGISGKLITSILRQGKTIIGEEVVTVLKRIVTFIREHWKNTLIVFRGDSHFAKPEVMDFIEQQPNIEYVIGLAKNSVLEKLSGLIRKDAYKRYLVLQKTVQQFGTIYYQAGSWNKARRVIVKAEVNEKGENPRFVVTSFEYVKATKVYQALYCPRGNAENYIKEHKGLNSDRTSCSSFNANQFRLFLHSIAYILLHTLRTKYLHNTEFSYASFHTIQLKILKVAARVRSLKTRICFHLPSSYPYQSIWQRLYRRFYPVQALSCLPLTI